MPTPLPKNSVFDRFSFLEMDEGGYFVEDGQRVSVERINNFLDRKIYLAPDTSDVFVWVHGWRNDKESALDLSKRLFAAIESVYSKQSTHYSRLRAFHPEFVSVRWPSQSSILPGGYRSIRDRAHAMTTDGAAEYVLAALLGYLEANQPEAARDATSGVLRAKGGYYVHCVGHSFGGRFLCQAVGAAADPQPPTGILRASQGRFPYMIDSLLVFQMAAPPNIFQAGQNLQKIVKESPITGPICLTHSSADKANCAWHKMIEQAAGIGCSGVTGAAGSVGRIQLRPTNQEYTSADFAEDIVNVDANWLYRNGNPFTNGAHSDYWYEESIHLLLSMANCAR